MTRKRVSLAELKVGDEVEIVESYPDALFTFRGTVYRADSTQVLVGDESYYRSVLATISGRNALQVDVEVEDPPAVHGAVVKYYDPNFLRVSVAHYVDPRKEPGNWFDLTGGGPVELDGKEWTVLFDPRKDG